MRGRYPSPPTTAGDGGGEELVQSAWPAVSKFIVTKPLGATGGSIILAMVTPPSSPSPLPPTTPMRSIGAYSSTTEPAAPIWLRRIRPGSVYPHRLRRARVALLIGLTAAFVGATGGAFLGVIGCLSGRQSGPVPAAPYRCDAGLSVADSGAGYRYRPGPFYSQCGAGHRHPHHSAHGSHRPLQRPEHQRKHVCRSGPWHRQLARPR